MSKPILHFDRNNTGRIHIAITEFRPHHTQVLSQQDSNGMPVQSVMQRRFDTLVKVIDCEVDDQINVEFPDIDIDYEMVVTLCLMSNSDQPDYDRASAYAAVDSMLDEESGSLTAVKARIKGER